MYKLTKRKLAKRYEIKDKEKILKISGFMMNKNKAIVILDSNILNIKVVDKKLASPLVINTLTNKYNNLIKKVMALLVEDDDTGESYREALNEIERFRLIIKNKYQDYLEKKMLAAVAKQLTLLEGEVNNRFLEIQNYNNNLEKTGKSR